MHIQLWLGEDIFKAFMVSIDIAHIAQQIMSPDFQKHEQLQRVLSHALGNSPHVSKVGEMYKQSLGLPT
jgi:hypothetical protein